jgi:UTP--glucose-1-phosphate uridylyltransferase
MTDHLAELVTLMQNNKLNDVVIKTFSAQYKKVLSGDTGIITEKKIAPPRKNNLVDLKDLVDRSNNNLDKLIVLKLNGGLGTSMGLSRAKSLLRVKGENTFLDIIALQILQLRKNSGKQVPLMFMNSFNTREDTLNELSGYKDLKLKELPLDFLQNKFPKIKQVDLSPLNSQADKHNWNPPGHGEIYTVLQISGILDLLLDQGYEFAFISNSDNLGAVVDNRILNYFSTAKLPFLMEVCVRTDMDKKGGHLAESKEGQLLLREVAQCPESELNSFQNIEKYKYFNTNNLWINLKKLKVKLSELDNILTLPLILNKKEADGVKVYQIESAMGAAISSFKDSKAIVVGRNRFIPVKKTNDLLAVWSDSYKLTPEYHLELENIYNCSPTINLDENYYKKIDQLEERIIEIPSLNECRELSVEGNVFFGNNVKIKGDVEIKSAEKQLITDTVLS